MEIRQISADERPSTMFPLQGYAFEGSPGSPADVVAQQARVRYFTTTTSLVAEEDGRALACAAGMPMRQNVRGVLHDMQAIASVAVHPEARRRGFARDLVNRLLRQGNDEGRTVSCLYPFRPSFYARFGFVGLPQRRLVSLDPAGLGRVEVPGASVQLLPNREAFDVYAQTTALVASRRHGFAVYDETRFEEWRGDPVWVAVARSGGEVVGVLRYRIDGFGGELTGEDLLTTGPLGRALLLGFLARHVDQVERITLRVDPAEAPELWATDLTATIESRVSSPLHRAPMARVSSLPALAGLPAGEADVTVEVVDDELIGGVWSLSGAGGALTVAKGTAEPSATLTAAGLSGLVYGVLDPVDVVTRGLGSVPVDAFDALRTLFPRQLPWVCANF
ncbi:MULTISPECIES: GNAT family N-acetyltransferase [Actinoplanes]|uniref:GNAT family N-acetyltransferase n=1 Tax=Actinoplanes TaxID=1865 RepID=UPI0005F2EF28|nr:MULTISPECIES: GNAT family N-acetyltransferase [Actinoplanes]GLY04584.1 hypothetical protein Acsp01_49630 [Actinoplanes sp. NBRC 101535]